MTTPANFSALLWLPKVAVVDWRRDSASVRTDQPMFDLRLYLVPDRELVEKRGDALYRSLPAIQLWRLGDAPVRVPRKGPPAILVDGTWQPLPLADLLSRSRPCSFHSFAALWPDLVSVDEYLSESGDEIPALGLLQQRTLASAAELLEQEVLECRLEEDEALRLLEQFAGLVEAVPAEIAAERHALESEGYEPTAEWEGRLASSRLATPLVCLSVQLQLAAAGSEVPLHLLTGSEILQQGLAEDLVLLAAHGERLTAVLAQRKKEELDGMWREVVSELAKTIAAEHLARCGEALAAIHTFASCRDLYWAKAEGELALLDRSCRREARKERIVLFLTRSATGFARFCLAGGRTVAGAQGALLRRSADLLRTMPGWFRPGQREA